jgi:hypothetical protein
MTKSQAVKVSAELVENLRDAAELHSRSIAGQAEHWMRLGRLVERDPRFGVVAIEQALSGQLSPDALTGDQQEVYLDRVASSHWDEPSAEEDRLFAQLVEDGGLVGYASDDSATMESSPASRRLKKAPAKRKPSSK